MPAWGGDVQAFRFTGTLPAVFLTRTITRCLVLTTVLSAPAYIASPSWSTDVRAAGVRGHDDWA